MENLKVLHEHLVDLIFKNILDIEKDLDTLDILIDDYNQIIYALNTPDSIKNNAIEYMTKLRIEVLNYQKVLPKLFSILSKLETLKERKLTFIDLQNIIKMDKNLLQEINLTLKLLETSLDNAYQKYHDLILNFANSKLPRV